MSVKMKIIMIFAVIAAPFITLGSIDKIGVLGSRYRLKQLCAVRRLPTILNAKEWADWSRKVRAITNSEGSNDPEQLQRLVALARRENVSFISREGRPYKFPYDGVWGWRIELVKNGAVIAALIEYTVYDTGPVSRRILGPGVGGYYDCSKKDTNDSYSNLARHEFIFGAPFLSKDAIWAGDVL